MLSPNTIPDDLHFPPIKSFIDTKRELQELVAQNDFQSIETTIANLTEESSPDTISLLAS